MTGFWRCICQRPAGVNVVAMDDHVALEHKAQAEVAKWQNSAVEDQARIRELEADLAKYQACRVRDVDEKAWLSKRMSELEAALRGYYEFHTKHDTREGHRKKCSRWSGDLNCSCGGDDLSRAVVLALTPSETVAKHEG